MPYPKHLSKSWLLATGLILLIAYFLAPIYGFLSHKEKVPRLSFNWDSIPTDYPEVQVLDDPRYAKAAEQAFAALIAHRQKVGAPSYSAAVNIDGKRVWAGAVGWQDLATKQAVSVETQFRIGSTSKALTATTLARMMQSQLIDLDQPLSGVYAELPNPQWSSITPRQLASHTAGLVHYRDTQDISGKYRFMALNKRYDNVEDAVALFDDTPLLFSPGDDFSYSSLGTVLLSATMQRAAQKPFQQLVRELVLEPLAMGSTLPTEDSTRLATHYWRSKKGISYRIKEWRRVDLSHRLAGGGFISTPSDLAKLGAAYFDATFLSADTVRQFWQPQALNNGEVNEQNYALGWRRGDYTNETLQTPMYHHGGVSRGAQSWLVVFPEYKMSIAINANINTAEFSDFASIYREIVDAFLDARRR